MKSLVTDGKGGLDVVEVTRPAYNEYQALVKMESCGLCRGTDTKLIQGKFKGFDSYPAILGHEGVGRVVEVGNAVKSFKIGDLVLLPFVEGMTEEKYHSGWGAFSEYAVVGDAQALIADDKGPGNSLFSEAYYAQQIVPDDIPVVDAAMIVTFREVLAACRRFGFQAGESIVIFGAGPVGLTFAKFAKLLGMAPVVVSVNRDEKLQEALDAGADYAFNSRKTDIVSEVRKLFPNGVDYAVDAIGANEVLAQSMKLVRNDGKICCYGVSSELKMELDWSKAAYNWSLHFLQWPSKLEESQCHDQIISWIRSGELVPADYISDVLDFSDIGGLGDYLEKGRINKKMIIRFG
ncbi:zinc-dependent alcohol dehydrogenase [Cohnella abietis]|uniref:Sorbitol dehydrogenase n=1 Tax=Cohnella abietis TaxID=2507935 RepID=A0A3T1D426_9BACL|nr:medium chain dehydrogenase/reductase family protein [Cohnella abietis]BBI32844.1 sorbitol dehydrogenase [Cohnella abietis]